MPADINNLTTKQKRFCKEIVRGDNPTEAAAKVYDCQEPDSAKSVGWGLMEMPKIQRQIELLMEKNGISDMVIVNKLKDGLEAKVVTEYMGDAIETEIPDLKIRHKYLESAIDIKGLKAPDKSLNLNVDAKFINMTKEQLIKEIEENLSLLKQGK